MEKIKFLTEASPWFIFLCILAGLGFAWLLYSLKSPWNSTINKVLFGLRFIVVTLLCILLIGPLVKLIKNYLEKPTYVLAIDNSYSLKLVQDSTKLNSLKQELGKLADKLNDEDLNIEIRTLDPESKVKATENIHFTEKTTNLSKVLSGITGSYENRNLGGIILMSDGIYNEGGDPLYEDYNFPIYTIGSGDPIEKKDLKIKNIKYNKIAYAGNNFPIVAEIENYGFKGSTTLQLKQGDKILAEKTINLDNKSLIQAEFTVSGSKAGLQHFVLQLKGLQGEFTLSNNEAHAYIDIIDAKEKILLAALSPHPDINALRTAIESKENYEIDLYIPGINKLEESKYDLVIFHQLPDNANANNEIIERLFKLSNSYLFMVGNQSNLNRLNQLNPILQIQSNGQQKDLVGTKYNNTYSRFLLDAEDIKVLNSNPPITVPFGEYHNSDEAEVILYQKLGSVETDNPILISGQKENKKYAILTGEGIWQWRINEAKEHDEAKVFNKLFTNLIQYLSSKEDKRKFRLFPSDNEYSESDRILFQAELYNDIYENIYGQRVDLSIKDEKGKSQKYAFNTSADNSGFEVKGLKPGLYKYFGSVKYNNKTYTASGEFVIRETQLEALNLKADFGMLKELATKTGGQFVESQNMDQIAELIKKQPKPAIIHSNEEFHELINLPWVFFLLLVLISAEWGMRKYYGKM